MAHMLLGTRAMTSLRLRLVTTVTIAAAAVSFPSADARACVGSEPACMGKQDGAACHSRQVFGVCRKTGCAETPALRCDGVSVCNPADSRYKDACAGKGKGDACSIAAIGAGTCVEVDCASGSLSFACHVPTSAPPSTETPATKAPSADTPAAEGAPSSGAPTSGAAASEAAEGDGGCSVTRSNRRAVLGGAASIAIALAAVLGRRRRRPYEAP